MEFQTVCVFGEEAPLSNRPQPRFTVIGRLFKAGCDQEKEYFSLILRLQKFLQQSREECPARVVWIRDNGSEEWT
jgi:hypothetical protein